MDQVLDAIERVIKSQLLTRQAHLNNKQVLSILKTWVTEEEKPNTSQADLMRCLSHLDQIVANCLLSDYDHEFLSNGFVRLAEVVRTYFSTDNL